MLVEKKKGEPFDNGSKGSGGQYENYAVLPATERAQGFVRPLRHTYIHEKCGTITRMSVGIAETYARDPDYYGATFCLKCRDHYPVNEFVWAADGLKVGS